MSRFLSLAITRGFFLGADASFLIFLSGFQFDDFLKQERVYYRLHRTSCMKLL